jgi:hypothetical protein
MAAEGMVHALQLIHGLLQPGGRLIDIHPSGEPPTIEVRQGQESYLAGSLQESDDFIEYAQAAAALHSVVEAGWYQLERQSAFTFCACAGSLEELSDFLRQNYTDAILSDEVQQQAHKYLNLAQSQDVKNEYRVVMSEHVHIASYRPIARQAVQSSGQTS